MKRDVFIKRMVAITGGSMLLGCDHKSVTDLLPSSVESFDLNTAKDWYTSFQVKDKAAQLAASNFIPRWPVGWQLTLNNGDQRVVIPVKYTSSSLPGFAVRSKGEDKNLALVTDVVNYGRINLMITKAKDGTVKAGILVALPTKEYIERKSLAIEGHDFSGELLFFNLGLNHLEYGHKLDNGSILSTYGLTNPNARSSMLQEVCTDHYYYVCSGGTCSDAQYSYTDCTYADIDDGSSGNSGGDAGGSTSPGGGGTPTIVSYSKYTADPINYINLYGYLGQSANDWEDYNRPCDNYTYKGETGLTSLDLFIKLLFEKTMDHFGITDIVAAASILSGANLIGTRAKFGGATPGTSFLSKYISPLIPGTSPVNLPTITGFPGVGQGLRIVKTRSVGRFITRGIPVIGYGLAIYDILSILKDTVDTYYEVAQTSGCL